MTPHQLRSFLAVAELGSVREAATALFVTQPAVSAAVAALERELGVVLLERDGRGVRLSDAGRTLADYAVRIEGLSQETAVAVSASADPEKGTLRLAAVTTAGEHVVPSLLSSFRREHPHVRVELEVANRRRVWEALDRSQVDLAVAGRPPEPGGFEVRATSPHQLVLVSAAASKPAPLDVRALAEQTWLVREPGSGTRLSADELLAELEISPLRLTLGSNGAIRECALVGLGVTLLPRASVERELAEGSLIEWEVEPLPLQRAWHLVVCSGRTLPATAQMFADHVTGLAEWSR